MLNATHQIDRLCPFCRIRWQGTTDQRACPKCHCDPFLTMNAGDIGTAMQLESASLTLKDFEMVAYEDQKEKRCEP